MLSIAFAATLIAFAVSCAQNDAIISHQQLPIPAIFARTALHRRKGGHGVVVVVVVELEVEPLG
jgi:hypothetical protein